jgi:hypothetical protein
MSPKIPLQDSHFEKVWREMDQIEPLTPIISDKKNETINSLASYREAAEQDSYLFGDYDAYSAYNKD